jgi:flagellar basal-body rod protein FlgB
MDPVHLFSLASDQARWLSLRQTTVAQNVANANTPKYAAVDVTPFNEVLDRTALTLASTNPGHISLPEMDARASKVKKGESWSVTHSKNSVSLEKEMIKAGEINGAYSLNRNLVSTFGRMLTAAVR